jgi:hypothetical protein
VEPARRTASGEEAGPPSSSASPPDRLNRPRRSGPPRSIRPADSLYFRGRGQPRSSRSGKADRITPTG